MTITLTWSNLDPDQVHTMTWRATRAILEAIEPGASGHVLKVLRGEPEGCYHYGLDLTILHEVAA